MSTNHLARSSRLLFILMALIATILAGCGGGGGGDNDGGGGTVTAPVITVHPNAENVAVGETATFTVAATGGSLSYQWQRLNDPVWTNLTGETSNTLTLAPTEADDAGSYRVIVSNSAGTATSNPATLTVSADTGDGTVIVD